MGTHTIRQGREEQWKLRKEIASRANRARARKGARVIYPRRIDGPGVGRDLLMTDLAGLAATAEEPADICTAARLLRMCSMSPSEPPPKYAQEPAHSLAGVPFRTRARRARAVGHISSYLLGRACGAARACRGAEESGRAASAPARSGATPPWRKACAGTASATAHATARIIVRMSLYEVEGNFAIGTC